MSYIYDGGAKPPKSNKCSITIVVDKLWKTLLPFRYQICCHMACLGLRMAVGHPPGSPTERMIMDDLLMDIASEAWWDYAMEQWYAHGEDDWTDPMEDESLWHSC